MVPPDLDTPSSPLRARLAELRMPATEAPEFDAETAPEDPYALLTAWFDTAIDGGVAAPHAMTLATATPSSGPSARTVLLTDLVSPTTADRAGWFEFATSADSPKGRDLSEDQRAALVLHWREQHRQIRVTGVVSPAPREDSEQDFIARSPASRAGIVAGRQSDPLPSRDARARLTAGAQELLAVNPRFVPPSWTLYRLQPATIEFWQGQPRTAQQRVRYSSDPAGWRHEMLWP